MPISASTFRLTDKKNSFNIGIMAGHSKWAQIKRQKGSEDAKRSKLFSKLSRLITSESKRANGDLSNPSLRTILEKAKKENMPKDTIERAVKKGTEKGAGELYEVTYEAYGPGGAALVIFALTDNKNRAVQEVKAMLAQHGATLAASGAALWAFEKKDGKWEGVNEVTLNDTEGNSIAALIEDLEELDDVQYVATNAA
ncbi:YebC/PmpR family DNA-binding transcriptional regulator [Candidatus Parcubacteria bacterium]|nr:YebC/PmpR family DNA-binding transcriptional regulator [Candidatus Parcubacteria bacterium]